MSKIVRSYVSSHVYRTPTGLYYDDRTGDRLTARRGQASERAKERMKARIQDENGKLGYKQINIITDGRAKGEHGAKYYHRPAEVSVSYDPEINEKLALKNAAKHLDEDEPEIVHFNVHLSEEEVIEA